MRIPLISLCLFLASVVVGQQPPAPKDPGTWILQIEGNSAGLHVTGATHKNFGFRAQRHLASRYRLRLLDAKGRRLSSIPIDLTDFCLDPTHRGKKDHVRGDVIIQHKIVTTVKVPALPAVAEIQIISLLGKQANVLGKVDRKSIITFAGSPKEVK